MVNAFSANANHLRLKLRRQDRSAVDLFAYLEHGNDKDSAWTRWYDLEEEMRWSYRELARTVPLERLTGPGQA